MLRAVKRPGTPNEQPVAGQTERSPGGPAPEPPTRPERNPLASKAGGDRILRFRRSERLLHWALALPFLLCLGTGLVLVLVYNPDPLRPHRAMFSWVHRISGAGLILLPLIAFASCWRDVRVYLNNLREGWVWSVAELKWLMLMPLSLLSKKVVLPEENKFNAGEKLNFMATTLAYPLMGATGIILWLEDSAVLPWLIHFSMAVAVLPLIGGHIFLATLNPSTRKALSGMVSGFVDREWAKHHYRRWYRQTFLHARGYSGEHRRLGASPGGGPVRLADSPVAATLLHHKRSLALGFVIVTGVVVTTPAGLYVLRSWAVPASAPAPTPTGLATIYSLEEQPLLSAPREGAESVPGGPIPRGARLTRVGEAGLFLRVYDLRERDGYVRTLALGAQAPALNPTYPFPDCHRVPGEDSPARCQKQADALLETCHSGCQAAQQPVCGILCQERHEECKASCASGLEPEAPPPAILQPAAAKLGKKRVATAKDGKRKIARKRR